MAFPTDEDEFRLLNGPDEQTWFDTDSFRSSIEPGDGVLREQLPGRLEVLTSRLLPMLAPQFQNDRGTALLGGIVKYHFFHVASKSLRQTGHHLRRHLRPSPPPPFQIQHYMSVMLHQPRQQSRSGANCRPPLQLHHINYNHEHVFYRSSTPPEVSFWFVLTQSNLQQPFDRISREAVLIAQATKWIDPITYTGITARTELDLEGITGTTLMELLRRFVRRVYQPEGTWQADRLEDNEEPPLLSYEVPHYLDRRTFKQLPIPVVIYKEDLSIRDLLVNDDGRLHTPKTNARTRGRSHRPSNLRLELPENEETVDGRGQALQIQPQEDMAFQQAQDEAVQQQLGPVGSLGGEWQQINGL